MLGENKSRGGRGVRLAGEKARVRLIAWTGQGVGDAQEKVVGGWCRAWRGVERRRSQSNETMSASNTGLGELPLVSLSG